MAVFYLTQAAKSDLKEIGRYTKREWGTAQRNKYLAMLDESFHMLAVHPFRGADCNDIREGYRKCKYGAGSHVIFYRQVSTAIEIVRILHGSMDTARHLLNS